MHAPLTRQGALQVSAMTLGEIEAGIEQQRSHNAVFAAALTQWLETTALCHNLTLVTRNIRHFEPTGVRVFDPFGSSAAV